MNDCNKTQTTYRGRAIWAKDVAWVEGNVYYNTKMTGDHIIPLGYYILPEGGMPVEVDRDTISEYLGVEDVAGYKLYEGDVVQLNTGELYELTKQDRGATWLPDCLWVDNVYDNPDLTPRKSADHTLHECNQHECAERTLLNTLMQEVIKSRVEISRLKKMLASLTNLAEQLVVCEVIEDGDE